MSLFASAFDSTEGAGPSFTPPSKTQSGQKKRKRPSLPADGSDKDGQLRSTQANLQKLMKGLEGGSGRERDGGENMGSIKVKKNANKQKHQYEDRHEHEAGGKKGGKHDSPASAKAGKPIMAKDKDASTKSKSQSKSNANASAKASQVEPAELPLPHTIKGHEHESSENEGLTKMQRDMKAKLEGARFRSA